MLVYTKTSYLIPRFTFLAPSGGGATPVTLTIRKTLSFHSSSTYKVALDSHTHAIDAVVANGISIDGAQFSITDLSNDVLPIGAVFTVIQNTSTNAISGTLTWPMVRQLRSAATRFKQITKVATATTSR